MSELHDAAADWLAAKERLAQLRAIDDHTPNPDLADAIRDAERHLEVATRNLRGAAQHCEACE